MFLLYNFRRLDFNILYKNSMKYFAIFDKIKGIEFWEVRKQNFVSDLFNTESRI